MPGFRSLAASWLGGASSTPVSTVAGHRGLLAPWLGGASAGPVAATQAGYRSLLAPWMGGGAAGVAGPPASAVRRQAGFMSNNMGSFMTRA